MSSQSLAPSNNSPANIYQQTDDPFVTPASTPIQPPRPCAQRHSRMTTRRHPVADSSDETGYDSGARYPSTAEYKSASISSSGSGSVMTPMSSIDLEKGRLAKEQDQPPTPRQHDPEKVAEQTRNSMNTQVLPGESASVAYSQEDEDEVDGSRRLQEQKALHILLFLSGPCVLLSSLHTAWACIALVITVLTQPIRLCAQRPSFDQQLGGLLGPTLNLQLRCIYTPLPPHANEDASYHVLMLVVVHMLSPFISLGMVLVAWVVAAFWVSSMVVGDPAGTDKRDDGRETVLTLRGWWECWLMKGVKEMSIGQNELT